MCVGKLPDNSTLTLDQIVASFRSSPTDTMMTSAASAGAAVSPVMYDYHLWDQDSMMEFLSQAHSVLDSRYAVKEFIVYHKELLVVLQKL